MSAQAKSETVPVTYRLDRGLVERLRNYTHRSKDTWPPGPSQTEIVSRGIDLVLKQLENSKRAKV